jgi:hypothetical protein
VIYQGAIDGKKFEENEEIRNTSKNPTQTIDNILLSLYNTEIKRNYMAENKLIKNMLQQVSEIVKKHKELAPLAGENFNIFRTLGVQNEELSHSRILAMLLNPGKKAPHGKGDVFLRLFLKCLNILIDYKGKGIDYQSLRVDREFKMDDGRIDIYIHDPDFGIVIENKIYADDQQRQVEKYYNFLQKNYQKGNFYLLYLSLYGKEPDTCSMGKLSTKEIFCVSYKDHICNWLEECQKESFDRPMLHETIAQYISLLRGMTGQSRSKKMSEEIVNILKQNPDSIAAAFSISNSIQELEKDLITNGLLNPLKEYASNKNLSFSTGKFGVFDKYFGFSLKKEDKGWENIAIRFEFGGPAGSFTNFYYGIWGKNELLTQRLKAKNISLPHNDNNHIFYKSIDGYENWNNGEIFSKLINENNDVVETIKTKIEEILKEIEPILKS